MAPFISIQTINRMRKFPIIKRTKSNSFSIKDSTTRKIRLTNRKQIKKN